jgi:hypothetical protein
MTDANSKEVKWMYSVLDECTLELKSLCLMMPAAQTPTLKDAIGPETAFLLSDYLQVAQAYDEFFSFPFDETRQEEADALANVRCFVA